ncbi:MAG: PD-(D/E)XK nuclease family protein [Thermoguttaceae bacterium]
MCGLTGWFVRAGLGPANWLPPVESDILGRVLRRLGIGRSGRRPSGGFGNGCDMAIERVFLDWSQPGLAAAAEYLLRRFGASGPWDMSGVVAATPGGRAGRRLLEILVDLAQRQDCVLTPPKIVTVGKLPELLYKRKKPFAGDLCQRLAWVEAMQSVEPSRLQRIVPSPPSANDRAAWLALADVLARLHRELAADGFNFASVVELGPQVEGFGDAEIKRWEALADVQRQYLDALDSLGLWDLQTARLFAIRNGLCCTDARIVLIGAVDLNRSQRKMLDQVADRVTSLVVAPSELAACFDEHGCLHSPAWLGRPIALADEQIDVVDDPVDQAEAVVRAIAEMDGRFRAEEISIGMPDESLVPLVEQHLRQCDVAVRYGVGRSLAGSPPGRLLSAVAEFLESPRFAGLAALVRHPDVERWLNRQGVGGDWLAQLDEYFSEHLSDAIDDEWLGEETQFDSLRRVSGEIRRLLQDLGGPAQPLDHWGRPIAELLLAVFGRSPLDPSQASDHAVLSACEEVRDALREQASIPAALMPSLSVAEAMRLVLDAMAEKRLAPPKTGQSVELLGWLELPLDDAPSLVVTTLNEGRVPGSLNGDLFLPNQLRRALEIEDNDRRYARDAYALAVLTASRRFLRLVVGRRNADGDPMMPSRLLFACDPRTVAQRVRRFCATPETSDGKPVSSGVLQPGPRSVFEPPRPRPLAEPVRSMRVTEFKDYLECPYRYYLRHQLRLAALRDSGEELDGRHFGTLAHAVLGEFGKSEAAEVEDVETIERFLDAELDRQLAASFGRDPLSVVLVQAEQLRLRLHAFARWQAEWARQGWRIEQVEIAPPSGKAALVVDGSPMGLRGRIDRIDVHRDDGRRMIIDYKTSDTTDTPERAHRRNGQWIDLQLPLYRHLVRWLEIVEPVELAYVVLPKNTAATGLLPSDWTAADLDDADRTAAEVVRGVRAERFWPPAKEPPGFSEDFAPICLDGQFRALLAAEAQQGANEL